MIAKVPKARQRKRLLINPAVILRVGYGLIRGVQCESVTITLPSQPSGVTALRVFTSSNSNYWQTSTIPAANGSATVNVPGYGIVTLYGASPAILTARMAAPDRLALSWPRANAGFVLQSSSSLVPPVVWTPDTNVTMFSSGIAMVSEMLDSGTRFYRLVLP